MVCKSGRNDSVAWNTTHLVQRLLELLAFCDNMFLLLPKLHFLLLEVLELFHKRLDFFLDSL